jgi:hypothetical protein
LEDKDEVIAVCRGYGGAACCQRGPCANQHHDDPGCDDLAGHQLKHGRHWNDDAVESDDGLDGRHVDRQQPARLERRDRTGYAEFR